MKRYRLPLSMAVFTAGVLLVYRDSVLGEVLGGLEALTAKAAFALILASGVEAVRDGTVISQPGGFAYQIYYRCTGILPAAALSVFILASPGRWKPKLWGLAFGVPLVFGANLIRLAHLFHVGVGAPQLFHLAHRYLWESAMMGLVLAFWLCWTVAGRSRVVEGR